MAYKHWINRGEGGQVVMATTTELLAEDPLGRPSSVFTAYSGPALSEEMVAAAESKLQVKLPESFLQFLRESNGSFLRRTLFRVPAPASSHEEYRLMRGLGYDGGLIVIQDPST